MAVAYTCDISVGQLIEPIPNIVVSVRVLVRQKVAYKSNKELVARIRQITNMNSQLLCLAWSLRTTSPLAYIQC